MATVIEITDNNARSISGTSKKTGEPYNFSIQTEYLHNGDHYPTKFEIVIDSTKSPYQTGFYDLASDSVYINRLGKLDVSPKLIPGASAPKK